MKYVVLTSARAATEIMQACNYIAESSPQNAIKWLVGLNKQIDSLEFFPRRFGRAREQDHFTLDYRQLVYKSHRIIYLINEPSKTVEVVSVRHAAQRTLGEPDDDPS